MGPQAKRLQDTDEPMLVSKHTEEAGVLGVPNSECATSVCGKGCGKVATGSRLRMQGDQ